MDLLKRLRNRSDSEHQQAIARTIIAATVLGYSLLIASRNSQDYVFYGAWFLGAFLVFSIVILVLIVVNPSISPTRRVVGMVSDLSAAGIAMHLLGEPGKGFMFIYLWVVGGNGLRYGPKYLYAAMVLGVLSYSILVATTPSWHNDVYLAAGYLGCLIILPIFFASLLKKLHASNTELTSLAEKLRLMASHDSLTGLPNRHHFLEALSHKVSDVEGLGRKFAVLFIDLDGFKNINDSHGHHSGDIVLITVANRLSSHIRKSDIVARLAGDEFVICLTDISRDNVKHVTRKLIDDIRAPIPIAEQAVYVSASIGVAIYPDSGATARDIMVKADMAMYRCKQHGKNCLMIDGDEESTPGHEITPSDARRGNIHQSTENAILRTHRTG